MEAVTIREPWQLPRRTVKESDMTTKIILFSFCHPEDHRQMPVINAADSTLNFYTLPQNSGRVYDIMLAFCVSIHLSYVCLSKVCPYFRFHTITWVNINGFSPNLVCALILWRSGLGMLMGKFPQFLPELSAHDRSIFSFPDDNFSKCHWIFTKLFVCIDIVKICIWIAGLQISSNFDRVVCPWHVHIFISGL